MGLSTKIATDIQIYVDDPFFSSLCLLECFHKIWFKFREQRTDSSSLTFDMPCFGTVDNESLLVPKNIIPSQAIQFGWDSKPSITG